MRALDLGDFAAWVAGTALAEDRLWQRELAQVSELDVQTYYARAGIKGCRDLALEAMDRLQSAMLLEATHGRMTIEDMRLIGHEVPRNPFMVDEFIDGMARLPRVRRAAVFWALQAGIAPEAVEELTWNKVTRFPPSDHVLQDLLVEQSKVRHLRLPYVFWEWSSEVVAAPLMHLQKTAERAFDRSWPALQVDFNDMIWVSQRADGAHFLGLLAEASARG